MKKFWIPLALSLALLSCSNPQSNPASTEAPVQFIKASNIELVDGLALLEGNCFTCHDPKVKSHDQMLAPPLAHIKQRYQRSFPEREVFIDRVSSFVSEPSMDKALMRGPVRRFGLMPKPPIAANHEDIEKIAAYLFDNPIEEPSWMAEHHQKKQGKQCMEKGCQGCSGKGEKGMCKKNGQGKGQHGKCGKGQHKMGR